ncbi:MAG: ZIP family metal transporter [Gemmatimonadaceae bacterium]
MTPILRVTLLYSLVPVCFTILGATISTFWPAMRRLRSHVLYLAAGVVFAVVAVELLPEIQRRALVGDVVLGFALGIGTMLGVDRVLDRMRSKDNEETDGAVERPQQVSDRVRVSADLPRATAAVGLSLLIAIGIDFLLDGLLLGVGFAAGARIGILLALAEAAEQLSVGLAVAGEMMSAGLSRTRVITIVTALGSLVFVSAVLGATVLSRLSGGAMEVVLSFGVAALLYLVTEELLREANEERETTTGTLMFFTGFLVFLVIGMTLE